MDNIRHLLNILRKYEFVGQEEDNYILSKKGEIATHIQEVNCLAFAEIIQSNTLNGLSAAELVSVFSSFTDLRVSDEMRCDFCQSDNINVYHALEELEIAYNKYYDMELSEFQYVDENNYKKNYDLNDLILDWCYASTETECKQVLGYVYNQDIFLGEFVKLILKINNIANELIKVCELTENIELKHKLSQIPELTLKYVVSNQSLYV